MIYTPAGKLLSKLLSNTDGWAIDRHRIRHGPTGTNWWIANGGWFFDGDDGTPSCLGLIERHLLWRKAKRLMNQTVADKLKWPA